MIKLTEIRNLNNQKIRLSKSSIRNFYNIRRYGNSKNRIDIE
jgi:hypothetical protein